MITAQGHDGLYLLVDREGKPAQRNAILQGGRAPQFEGSKGRITVRWGDTTLTVNPSFYGLSWELQGFYGLSWELQGLPDVPYQPAPETKSQDPLSW